MNHAIAFHDEDWARHRQTWDRFWAHDLDRPIVWITTQAQPAPPKPWTGTRDAPFDVPAEVYVDWQLRALAAQRFHGDAWPAWRPVFAPGMLAAFLGCDIELAATTSWLAPGRFAGMALADMRLTADFDNRWWRRLEEIYRVGVERTAGRATIGFGDVTGNLDALASMRDTNQLLLDVVDEPDEVERLMGEATTALMAYYDAEHAILAGTGRGTTCWSPIWSAGRTAMLQCDFAYMISPAMFERFVIPDLAACCARLDHGFYHLDGPGQIPHVDLLLGLKELRGIQWIPGAGAPPLTEWLPLLKRIRDGGKLSQLYGNPAEALAVVKHVGGRGFVLHVGRAGGFTPAEADALVQRLAKETTTP